MGICDKSENWTIIIKQFFSCDCWCEIINSLFFCFPKNNASRQKTMQRRIIITCTCALTKKEFLLESFFKVFFLFRWQAIQFDSYKVSVNSCHNWDHLKQRKTTKTALNAETLKRKIELSASRRKNTERRKYKNNIERKQYKDNIERKYLQIQNRKKIIQRPLRKTIKCKALKGEKIRHILQQQNCRQNICLQI